MRRILASFLVCVGALGHSCIAAPVLAAASDLRYAMDELIAGFTAASGLEMRVTYGSSGNFTRQIEQGAPFELFFSADESLVLRLAAKGLTRDTGALYAIGRIVLFAPHGSPLVPDPELRVLAALLERGEVRRFAIANPEHAPYGRAAREALSALGLWTRLQPHLVLGENVSQAAQFATGGDAVGGIFAYSIALAPEVHAKGRFVLLSERLHTPLRQRMVLLRTAGDASERFYAYMRTPAARAVLSQYGFRVPGS
jgi:molybdate transport system substrate-binding protein